MANSAKVAPVARPERFVFLCILTCQFLVAQNQAAPWLDTAPKPWNRAGRPLPKAPRGAALESFCSAAYKGTTPEEKQVTEAGWILTSPAQSSSGIAIVSGQAFSDGMCRPVEYNYFVFVRGVYAGSLSPVRMNSRQDSSLVEVIPIAKDRLLARFSRYVDRDPLCCPSRESEVEFLIQESGGKPLVVMGKVNTKPAP